jgi:mono/diheme cytochrome c family protein
LDFGIERLHALWTLEGLHTAEKEILMAAFHDRDPRVRAAAIRISEQYLKKNDAEILEALKQMASDEHPEVIQQLILSFRQNTEATKELVTIIKDKFADNKLISITASENLNPSFSEIQMLREKYKLLGGDAPVQIVAGYKIFQDHCSTCHGSGGKGIDQLAPPLVGSPRVTGDVKTTIKILLHGLHGPIDGKSYNGPMASVAQYNDVEISNIVSYIRAHLNNSSTVWRSVVRNVREEYGERKNYWTLKELEASTKK